MSEEQIEQQAEVTAEVVVDNQEAEVAVDTIAGKVAEAVVEPVIPSVEEEKIEVYFEGKKVVEVIGDGPNSTVKEVKFDDGTTGHIPLELLS